MTRKEALRQTEQESRLLELGFTRDEAESLRRISMTLHRWYELECGTDTYCLVRGTWNKETAEFEYDDNGAPHYEFAGGSGRSRYSRVPDRERGAVKRLETIIKARNLRVPDVNLVSGDVLQYYLQTDPRGAVLYIIRPGDVPAGKDIQSYYNRGLCVW